MKVDAEPRSHQDSQSADGSFRHAEADHPEVAIDHLAAPDVGAPDFERILERRLRRHNGIVRKLARLNYAATLNTVSTIVLALVTLFLWRATESMKESASIQAQAAQVQADAARDEVSAATSQAASAQIGADATMNQAQTARVAAMAYVRTSEWVVENVGDSAMQLTFTFKNYGQTYAKDFTYKQREAIIPLIGNDLLIEPFDEIADFSEVENRGIIFPGETFDITRLPQKPFTKVELNNLKQSRARYIVWGIASYHDAFDQPRWTKFCRVFSWDQQNNKLDKGGGCGFHLKMD